MRVTGEVENRYLPLTWPMAYTTPCTTAQAVICCPWIYYITVFPTADEQCNRPEYISDQTIPIIPLVGL